MSYTPAEQDPRIMTIKDWFIVGLINIIPIVSIIVLIYWATRDYSTYKKPSLIGYARVMLIIALLNIGFLLLYFTFTGFNLFMGPHHFRFH